MFVNKYFPTHCDPTPSEQPAGLFLLLHEHRKHYLLVEEKSPCSRRSPAPCPSVCMGIQEAPRTFSESLTCFSKCPPAEAAICAWGWRRWVEMAKGISKSRAGLGTGGKWPPEKVHLKGPAGPAIVPCTQGPCELLLGMLHVIQHWHPENWDLFTCRE